MKTSNFKKWFKFQWKDKWIQLFIVILITFILTLIFHVPSEIMSLLNSEPPAFWFCAIIYVAALPGALIAIIFGAFIKFWREVGRKEK